ncbi:hypothetical protein [Streptomyces sp. V3I8]|uniref:hypothetical protein n=1 Tax=Streptomyces sp. V3I8 TaxID=3042279 RepID=UPI0027D91BA0|nr:hypothetical protein [Streptomyces sp. V3I8]
MRGTVGVRQLRVDPTSATTGDRYGIASPVGVGVDGDGDGARLRAAAPDPSAARALDTAGLTAMAGDSGDLRVLATGARAGDLLTITSHGRKLRLHVVGALPEDVVHAARPRLPTETRVRVTAVHPYAPARGLTSVSGRKSIVVSRWIGDGPGHGLSTVRALLPCEPATESGAVLVRVPGLGDDR